MDIHVSICDHKTLRNLLEKFTMCSEATLFHRALQLFVGFYAGPEMREQITEFTFADGSVCSGYTILFFCTYLTFPLQLIFVRGFTRTSTILHFFYICKVSLDALGNYDMAAVALFEIRPKISRNPIRQKCEIKKNMEADKKLSMEEIPRNLILRSI